MTSPTRNNHTKIRLRQLCKSFGEKAVLQGIDLDVPTGSSCVIIGASGSGKSVLIKCILGLLEPDQGDILINGATRTTGAEWKNFLHQCGVLFQGGALFDSMNVADNITFALRQRGMDHRSARQVAQENLDKVGLGADVLELYPDELSGGMKKRVGLARAIATSPSLLFFDEPTTGLDPIMSAQINRLIRQCVHNLGATAITITHDMESARYIAHSVAMIHEGRIIWHDDISQMDHSQNPHLKNFLHAGQDAKKHRKTSP